MEISQDRHCLKAFSFSSVVAWSMASLQLGTVSLINESWVVLGSSLKLRIGFRSKRLRLVKERWRFRAQQKTKHELAHSAKRSESLRYILKQYGISIENPEDNKTSSRLDDLNCEEKQHDNVPSSAIDDTKLKSQNTTEELPDLRRQEIYRETVGMAKNSSVKNRHNLPHLNTGALFSSLLPLLGFCIVCIIGMLHSVISRNLKESSGRKTSQDHHHHGSKRTRWSTVLNDWNEPLASDEHDSSPENRVGPADQEAAEAYSRVELEYQRFLSECGVVES